MHRDDTESHVGIQQVTAACEARLIGAAAI